MVTALETTDQLTNNTNRQTDRQTNSCITASRQSFNKQASIGENIQLLLLYSNSKISPSSNHPSRTPIPCDAPALSLSKIPTKQLKVPNMPIFKHTPLNHKQTEKLVRAQRETSPAVVHASIHSSCPVLSTREETGSEKNEATVL